MCSAILRDPAQLPRTARVSDIQYFTALAKHMEARSPGIVRRHRAFIDAQQALGVTVHLGAFKRTAKGFEEKETDVAIGVALLEIFYNSDADCVFIMSGDTDIMPALRAARRMYSGCRIGSSHSPTKGRTTASGTRLTCTSASVPIGTRSTFFPIPS